VILPSSATQCAFCRSVRGECERSTSLVTHRYCLCKRGAGVSGAAAWSVPDLPFLILVGEIGRCGIIRRPKGLAERCVKQIRGSGQCRIRRGQWCLRTGFRVHVDVEEFLPSWKERRSAPAGAKIPSLLRALGTILSASDVATAVGDLKPVTVVSGAGFFLPRRRVIRRRFD